MKLPGIKKEDFEKLNQLDRIECRLKYKEIEDSQSGLIALRILWIFVLVSLFLILLEVIFIAGDKPQVGRIFLELINKLIRPFCIMFWVAFLLDILCIIHFNIQIKKLRDDYFSIKKEVRDGKGNRRK